VRIILASLSFPTDAKIHDPMMAGLIDVVFNELGREYDAFWGIQGSVDLDSVVFRDHKHLVSPEKQMVYQAPERRKFCEPGERPPGGINSLKQVDKPDRTGHR
jgi:hypothetical protein